MCSAFSSRTRCRVGSEAEDDVGRGEDVAGAGREAGQSVAADADNVDLRFRCAHGASSQGDLERATAGILSDRRAAGNDGACDRERGFPVCLARGRRLFST